MRRLRDGVDATPYAVRLRDGAAAVESPGYAIEVK